MSTNNLIPSFEDVVEDKHHFRMMNEYVEENMTLLLRFKIWWCHCLGDNLCGQFVLFFLMMFVCGNSGWYVTGSLFAIVILIFFWIVSNTSQRMYGGITTLYKQYFKLKYILSNEFYRDRSEEEYLEMIYNIIKELEKYE